MTWVLDRVGRHIAAYLQRPAPGYEPFTPADPTALQALIKPGDILLIEGRTHIAGVIKYLTQSTWSHAALYVGPVDGQVTSKGEPCDLVESNLEAGIVSVPLSTYFDYHTRICRPVGLLPEDRQTVCGYAIERIGLQYDLKNIVDLGRYLVPLPVPQRYPILPAIEHVESAQARREIYHIRHSSLYAPRDFDISPYFAIIKPTIEMGFDYKKISWAPSDKAGHLPPPHRPNSA